MIHIFNTFHTFNTFNTFHTIDAFYTSKILLMLIFDSTAEYDYSGGAVLLLPVHYMVHTAIFFKNTPTKECFQHFNPLKSSLRFSSTEFSNEKMSRKVQKKNLRSALPRSLCCSLLRLNRLFLHAPRSKASSKHSK